MAIFNIPEASDWIQQYYEDYFRGFMTQAEWDVLAADFYEAQKAYPYISWEQRYKEAGLANYGISFEEFEAKVTAYRKAEQEIINAPGYDPDRGTGLSFQDWFGPQWQLYAMALNEGGTTPIIDYGPQITDLTPYGVTIVNGKYYYDDGSGKLQHIGNTFNAAHQWLFTRGLAPRSNEPIYGTPFNPNEALLKANGISYTIPTGLEREDVWNMGPGYYTWNGAWVGATEEEALAYVKSQPGYVEPGYTPPKYPAWEAPPEPPTPFMPAWQFGVEELTGIRPGERIRPGKYKIPSGQMMKRMTPSEMAGLSGLINWAGGRGPGAYASAQDYWAKAMGMLPKTEPRGTVRWATSPYR